jgi:hypothetical protein
MSDNAVEAENFIEQNADKLVHNLAHQCAVGAKEIVGAIGEQIPTTPSTDTLFLFLFSIRGTIEAQGVKKTFGNRAYELILTALENLYQKTFPEAHAQTGAFSQSLMKDVMESMKRSSIEDFIRAHATRTLGTQDPLDELLHFGLEKVLIDGQSIVQVVKQQS